MTAPRKHDPRHNAGIWRRDLCACDRPIIRNILTDELWSHWGVVACEPGSASTVATPRRTSAGDVLVAGGPQAGGAR